MQWLLSTLQTLLTFALVFSVLVFFHELGHFSAAKWLKMVVEEFAFGLPIPGTKRWFRYAYDGQTEYTVWPVLAGGFVRIKGMEIEDAPESTADTANPRSPVQWNEAMDATVEKMTGRSSEAKENSQGAEPFPTTTGRLLEQETSEVAGADPDGFNNRPIRHRFAVIFAGPLFSFIFGWLVLCSIGMLTGLPDANAPVNLMIGEVQKDSAADEAGLKDGDTILTINGRKVTLDEGLKVIRASPNKPLTFELKGDDTEIRTVTATPRAKTVPGEDKPVGQLGFGVNASASALRRVGPVESFAAGTTFTKQWFVGMTTIIRSGQIKDSLGGPVKIFKETQKASKRGPADTLFLAGQLSLSLGLFNLLPIPVLDGGHLLLMAVEFVRRKKLTGEQTARVLTGGFIFLALMTVIILVKDIFGL